MGAIGGLVGLGGGAAGSSFAGPAQAGTIGTTNSQEIGSAYNGSQQTLQQQQALLQAIQQQSGLANQSQTYNQLQGIANGTGPNPAQAQYQQNIQQLAQQQAGAISSTKGISPALQARLIEQQGSSAMQNAAGQGAANLANQQMGAINSAANIAGTQASNQIGQTNANAQAQQAEQSQILGATAQANSTAAGQQANINSANAGLAQEQMKGQQGLVGGVINGVGSLFADGGAVAPVFAGTPPQAGSAPSSKFGQFMKGMGGAPQTQAPTAASAPMTGEAALQQGSTSLVQGLGRAFKSTPETAGQSLAASGPEAGPDMAATGAMFAAKGGVSHDYRGGGGVKAKKPQEKAVKSGNSYANDKIPAVLSEGEVVIPRSVMQGKDPARGAAQFVQAVLAKKRARR